MTCGASVEGFAGDIVAVAIMVVLIFLFFLSAEECKLGRDNG